MTTSAVKRYSVEEYLELERAADSKSEFYDGEVFATSGASITHVRICLNLYAELRDRLRRGPCGAFTSDMKVNSPTGLYTYPDVSVVCGDIRFEGDREDILLNPIVIFEVLSPSTEAYDRGKKFEHYQSIASVQEYVLVAQDARKLDHYVRRPDGRWLLQPISEGELVLQSLNCVIPLEEIYENVTFQEPSPDANGDGSQ